MKKLQGKFFHRNRNRNRNNRNLQTDNWSGFFGKQVVFVYECPK